MPIVIHAYDSDGNGGFYIKFSDLSQSMSGYIHATPELLDEFVTHFRKQRGAPTAQLHAARDGMNNPQLPDAATVQLFRLAYSELIEDIIDLRDRGLRHNTPHDEHQAVKAGKKPHPKWLRDNTDDAYRQFREANA